MSTPTVELCRQLAIAAGASPYNSTAKQRQRIADFLRMKGQAGALAFEIQLACSVPCVTKRISELRRREGLPITTRPEMVASSQGLNEAHRYFLLEADERQGELDLDLR